MVMVLRMAMGLTARSKGMLMLRVFLVNPNFRFAPVATLKRARSAPCANTAKLLAVIGACQTCFLVSDGIAVTTRADHL